MIKPQTDHRFAAVPDRIQTQNTNEQCSKHARARGAFGSLHALDLRFVCHLMLVVWCFRVASAQETAKTPAGALPWEAPPRVSEPILRPPANPREVLQEHHTPQLHDLLGIHPTAQQINLAEDPAAAARLAELRQLLAAEMRRLNDPYSLSEN